MSAPSVELDSGHSLAAIRVPGVLGTWELRASDVGLTRVIVPSRLHEFPPLPQFPPFPQLPAVAASSDQVSPAARSITPAQPSPTTQPLTRQPNPTTQPSPTALALAHTHLALAAQEFAAYFAGTLTTFTVPLDRAARDSSFSSAVHHAISTIPYGHTVTYGDLAVMAGHPRAVRAVGSACGKNPLPVVVPCHRVIRADGSLGHYTGGAEYKEALLALETPPSPHP